MSTTSKTIDSIERLASEQVRVLWHADFWDGPINGLCQVDGTKCWFELWADDEGDFPEPAERRFLVLQLTPQQLAEEERWHDLFRQKVGTHCDYNDPHPEVKPQDHHREFYEAYEKRAKPDYSNNPIIGWCHQDDLLED